MLSRGRRVLVVCFGTWRSQASRPVLVCEVCFFFCVLGPYHRSPAQPFRQKKKTHDIVSRGPHMMAVCASFCRSVSLLFPRTFYSLRLPDVCWGALFPVRLFLKRCSVCFLFVGTPAACFTITKQVLLSAPCPVLQTDRRCILFWFLVYIYADIMSVSQQLLALFFFACFAI